MSDEVQVVPMVEVCPGVPDDPEDGQVFRCGRCGYEATFVVLDDGLPGEWVT